MNDFTQLSPEQIVIYVDKHSHLFASDFDEKFPGNIAQAVSGSLWTTIRRKEGFAMVYKGINELFGGDEENADLKFIYVLPEFTGKGIGSELVEAAKAVVPQGRPIEVTCEGEVRMRFFMRCGFTVRHNHTDVDLYKMQWTPSALSTEN